MAALSLAGWQEYDWEVCSFEDFEGGDKLLLIFFYLYKMEAKPQLLLVPVIKVSAPAWCSLWKALPFVPTQGPAVHFAGSSMY